MIDTWDVGEDAIFIAMRKVYLRFKLINMIV